MARLTVNKKGELIKFLSEGKANIRSCKVHFSPKQEGEGAPSPDNVRPIIGWTGVDITHCGKNLFDEKNASGAYSRGGRRYN